MKRILAESRHYKIIAEYEEVRLHIKNSGTEIHIGDFYGDPEGAIIDRSERFCITYGDGAVVYFLRKPFEPYRYGNSSEQWLEIGRAEPIKQITDAYQTDSGEVKLILESGEVNVIKI